MNFFDSSVVVSSILFLNIFVYMIFKKYLYGKQDAGMKFLTLNIAKDVIWVAVSLSIIEKTKSNFLLIVICFIAASILIYLSVIRLINKS